ncbi:hypothetical protein B0H19DRAFT_1032692 [Mycena capillaripes]|nr:hypothetical protein B0H19DRAFT_1032692 [Mycena capillaripes]
MRRRSPPTSLRLVQGPVPPRSVPRHTLPSQRWSVGLHRDNRPGKMRTPFLPPTILIPPTPSSRGSMRGPWDHSGSIPTPIDMESLLTPLKPVALVG